MPSRFARFLALSLAGALAAVAADPDWNAVNQETLKHFGTLVRIDTSGPPNYETPAVEYLKNVLVAEGIPVKVFTKNAQRPNLVARIKGNGSKRPLLLMAHTDVVPVQADKWTAHGPFSAHLAADGFIYGRGTIDDKDNL